MSFILIWTIIIVSHALIRCYLDPIYFDLTPAQRVKKGYLKFSENYKYQQSTISFDKGPNLRLNEHYHYRIDIQLRGLYRALFSPLTFDKELKKLNGAISDLNNIDPARFYKTVKNNKIRL